jgi:hypothetical protein
VAQKDKKDKARETGLFLAYDNFIQSLKPNDKKTILKNTEFYNNLSQWNNDEKQIPMKTPKDLIIHVP